MDFIRRLKATRASQEISSKDLSFDVVRVDADGSVVIAGRSAPFAYVRIYNREEILGSVRALPGAASGSC